jgi:hypothetical protein
MKPAPVVTFQVTEAPTIDKPGEATVSMTFARNRGEPVRVVANVRSDQSGRGARVQSGSGVAWEGGLVWAAFRWTEGDGPPDLLLSWFAAPPDLHLSWLTAGPTAETPDPPALDPLNYAEVSDVALLARDWTAQWAVRAFLDELPNVGRPSEAAARVEAIIAAAREVGPSATRLRVAEILGRVEKWGEERADYRRDVRAAGGWREIKRRAGF